MVLHTQNTSTPLLSYRNYSSSLAIAKFQRLLQLPTLLLRSRRPSKVSSRRRSRGPHPPLNQPLLAKLPSLPKQRQPHLFPSKPLLQLQLHRLQSNLLLTSKLLQSPSLQKLLRPAQKRQLPDRVCLHGSSSMRSVALLTRVITDAPVTDPSVASAAPTKTSKAAPPAQASIPSVDGPADKTPAPAQANPTAEPVVAETIPEAPASEPAPGMSATSGPLGDPAYPQPSPSK